MKKCYVIPDVKVTTIEIASMVCTSPFADDSKLDVPGEDAPVIGDGDELDARQRGGDFGSLW